MIRGSLEVSKLAPNRIIVVDFDMSNTGYTLGARYSCSSGELNSSRVV